MNELAFLFKSVRRIVRHGAVARGVCLAIFGIFVLTTPTWGQDPCAAPPVPVATLPEGSALAVTFSGVSTLSFSDGRDTVLVDGFFSRPQGVHSLFAMRSDPVAVNAGLAQARGALRAVLVAHAHHDHALDIAAIAQAKPSALIIGTPSVVNLLRRAQAPHPIRFCNAGNQQVYVFGAFKITAFVVDHGPSPAILRWILDHQLSERGRRPWWFGGFTDNENRSYLIEYGQRRILVHPSAGSRDMRPLKADTAFLGLGRVGTMKPKAAETYLSSTLPAETRLIIPIHWDGFTTPLGRSLRQTPRVADNVPRSFERLCNFSRSPPRRLALRVDAGTTLFLPQQGGFSIGEGEATALCD